MNRKNWRTLAAMAAIETDTARFMVLVAELTEALDEYREETTAPAKPLASRILSANGTQSSTM